MPEAKPRIIYSPRADATPEGELDVLAACYRFILDCHERKRAACESPPDDAEDLEYDHTPDKNSTR